MGDSEMSRSLLAHLCWRFHPRTEEVAVAALAHVLNRYPASREGLNELLERAVPGMELSGESFHTEVAHPDGTRFDVLQRGDDGKERLVIEAKFHAPLTKRQPVAYLNRQPSDGVSVLMFLAPAKRVKELWPQLLRRLDKGGMGHSDAGHPRCATIDGTGKHLLVTDWTTLLGGMAAQLDIEGRLEASGSGSGLAELQQLIGLAQFAEACEPKAPHPGEELVKQVTAMGEASGWLDIKGCFRRPSRGATGDTPGSAAAPNSACGWESTRLSTRSAPRHRCGCAARSGNTPPARTGTKTSCQR